MTCLIESPLAVPVHRSLPPQNSSFSGACFHMVCSWRSHHCSDCFAAWEWQGCYRPSSLSWKNVCGSVPPINRIKLTVKSHLKRTVLLLGVSCSHLFVASLCIHFICFSSMHVSLMYMCTRFFVWWRELHTCKFQICSVLGWLNVGLLAACIDVLLTSIGILKASESFV